MLELPSSADYICRQPEIVAKGGCDGNSEAVTHDNAYLDATSLPYIVPQKGEDEENGKYRQRELVRDETYSIIDYYNLPSDPPHGAEGEGRGASEVAGIQKGDGGMVGGGERGEEERIGSPMPLTVGLSDDFGRDSEIRTHSAINTPNKKNQRQIPRRKQACIKLTAVQLQAIFPPYPHSEEQVPHQQINVGPNDTKNQQNILLAEPEISYTNLQINPLQLLMESMSPDYNC